MCGRLSWCSVLHNLWTHVLRFSAIWCVDATPDVPCHIIFGCMSLGLVPIDVWTPVLRFGAIWRVDVSPDVPWRIICGRMSLGLVSIYVWTHVLRFGVCWRVDAYSCLSVLRWVALRRVVRFGRSPQVTLILPSQQPRSTSNRLKLE
jgi:hypothetical protein